MSKNTDLSELINYVKGKTSGQLVAPFYTSVSSFTGTLAGYLAFDSSGNILSVSAPSSQWVTSGSNIYYNLGNVVIGGTSPKLDALNRTNLTINGVSSTILTFGIGTAYASYMYSDSSLVEISTNTQPLAFTTNGAERLRILANGNVGINTSTPSYNLDVVGDINISGSYRINGVAIATNLITGSGTTNYITKWGSSSTVTNSLIFDNGSNLGVGTSSPSAFFHIKGGNNNSLWIDNNGSQYTSAYISNNGTVKSFLVWDNTNSAYQIGTATSSSIQFIVNNSERVRISSNGNVSIGTADNAFPLNVLSTTGFAIKLIGDSSSNNSNIIFYPNTGVGAGYASIGANATRLAISVSNTPFLDMGGTGGGIRIISSNGRVLIGSTADQGAFLLQVNSQIWATNSTIATSDLRLKENVLDLDSSLNLLMGIKPRTFTYKQDTEYNFTEKGVTLGFIAQELKELLEGTPYANSIVVEAGKYYGVAYEKIIPLLVKSIQELKSELDVLKQVN